MAWNRPAFPMRTVEGTCGPAGLPVTLGDLDRVFPKAVAALYSEEIETVLLVSERERWPADNPAAEFARNDFDAERSGDVFLVPNAATCTVRRDTRVPLVFWGEPFPAGRQERATTRYDLAPTLAGLLGIRLPDATGRSLLDAR